MIWLLFSCLQTYHLKFSTFEWFQELWAMGLVKITNQQPPSYVCCFQFSDDEMVQPSQTLSNSRHTEPWSCLPSILLNEGHLCPSKDRAEDTIQLPDDCCLQLRTMLKQIANYLLFISEYLKSTSVAIQLSPRMCSNLALTVPLLNQTHFKEFSILMVLSQQPAKQEMKKRKEERGGRRKKERQWFRILLIPHISQKPLIWIRHVQLDSSKLWHEANPMWTLPKYIKSKKMKLLLQ